MTELLFLSDSYLKEFSAKIIKSGSDFVVLDRTCFFYESSGQECDVGFLDDVKVLSVKNAGGEIRHFLESNTFKIGDAVKGIIDWKGRYALMRMHSAAHVLARTLYTLYNAIVVGGQLHVDISHDDYKPLTGVDKETIVREFNSIVSHNLPIITRNVPRAEAERIYKAGGLNFLVPASVSIVRLVEIKDFDVNACAGTHVKNTGEIGALEIVKVDNKGSGVKRIYFRLIPST